MRETERARESWYDTQRVKDRQIETEPDKQRFICFLLVGGRASKVGVAERLASGFLFYFVKVEECIMCVICVCVCDSV